MNIKLFYIFLIVSTSLALQVPNLNEAFWGEKLTEFLPDQKLKEILTRISADQSYEQQLETLQEFVKKLGSKTVRSKFQSFLKKAEASGSALNDLFNEMIRQFNGEVAEDQLSQYLSNSYKTSQKMDQAIDATILFASNQMTEKYGKEKTLDLLKRLTEWENQNQDIISSMKTFFKANSE